MVCILQRIYQRRGLILEPGARTTWHSYCILQNFRHRFMPHALTLSYMSTLKREKPALPFGRRAIRSGRFRFQSLPARLARSARICVMRSSSMAAKEAHVGTSVDGSPLTLAQSATSLSSSTSSHSRAVFAKVS